MFFSSRVYFSCALYFTSAMVFFNYPVLGCTFLHGNTFRVLCMLLRPCFFVIAHYLGVLFFKGLLFVFFLCYLGRVFLATQRFGLLNLGNQPFSKNSDRFFCFMNPLIWGDSVKSYKSLRDKFPPPWYLKLKEKVKKNGESYEIEWGKKTIFDKKKPFFIKVSQIKMLLNHIKSSGFRK